MKHLPFANPKLNNLQHRVLLACLSHFEVEIAEFFEGRRLERIVNARHCFWMILRQSGSTYREICDITGHDHKSVHYGCRFDRYLQLKVDLLAIKEALK